MKRRFSTEARKTSRRVLRAVAIVLHDPRSSKAAMTKAGRALTQRPVKTK